jgi:hypothetical protein
MSLSGIFIDLWRTASAWVSWAVRELNGGARLAVRVLGDVTTLTISRKQKPVGAVELKTFLRDCGVPESAVRFPQEGQSVREREGSQWHSVTYRWRNES